MEGLGRREMNSRMNNFWRGKKVLVTGHSGFKGGWLSLWLNMLGAKVYGYSLPPVKEGFFNATDLGSIFENSVFGDIRDKKELEKFVKKVRPEIVFHLAAQPLVLDSYESPLLTFETNVMGGVNLLEALRLTPNVKSVVFVTTDKCYYNDGKNSPPFETNAPLGGVDPYSCSKACAELLVSCYRSSFLKDLNIATARSGNTLGGGDYTKGRLISDLLIALRNPSKMDLNSLIRSPNSIRPWSSVFDITYSYLVLAEKLYSKNGYKYALSWNLAPKLENHTSFKKTGWIVNYILKQQGIPPYKFSAKRSPLEAFKLQIDSLYTEEILGTKHILSLKETLNLVMDWEDKYLMGYNMYEVSREHIRSYLQKKEEGRKEEKV